MVGGQIEVAWQYWDEGAVEGLFVGHFSGGDKVGHAAYLRLRLRVCV